MVDDMDNYKRHIKIGELAGKANILPSKIRFYMQEGLIEPIDRSPGGYYLFNEESALERLRLIKELQEKHRLNLHEIRDELQSRPISHK
jgi:DNA-binding transcriptional MerR regulator